MENQDVLVSVIVPVYGTEGYLPACIESILNQSYHNLQIILIDDGSPDKCPEICDCYAERDSRILVIHQNNAGVSSARNTGLCHAAGEYVMFVDSDDELTTNAVELLMLDALTYDADIVSAPPIGSSEEKYTQGNRSTSDCVVFQGDDSLLWALRGENNTNSVWSKVFRKAFIENIQFEPGKNINEDGYFMFLCFLRKPLHIRKKVAVYNYNNRPDSSSRQTFSDKYLSMLYFCERKKEIIASEYPQYMDQMHNTEVRTNLQMLDILCRTKEKKYRPLQKQCIATVRRLYAYHEPINEHHKLLAWVVAHGLYPLYKWAVRMKYYR